MQVRRRQIVELFLSRDDLDRAERAEALPDPVDLCEHGELLRALGIDPGLLATQIDNLEDRP